MKEPLRDNAAHTRLDSLQKYFEAGNKSLTDAVSSNLRKIQTLETTLLNLTARIAELESKVFPRCPQCKQLLCYPLSPAPQQNPRYPLRGEA